MIPRKLLRLSIYGISPGASFHIGVTMEADARTILYSGLKVNLAAEGEVPLYVEVKDTEQYPVEVNVTDGSISARAFCVPRDHGGTRISYAVARAALERNSAVTIIPESINLEAIFPPS